MSMRILLVEDEPSQQEALGIALTAFGYTVIAARDVPEAIGLLDDPYDAVILDVRLPDPTGLNRDGLTLLGEFRARQPIVPVAVFTGIPLTQAEELFAASQNVTLLYKPQSLDRILAFLALHAAQQKTTAPARVI
jgi:DNA-binding response OmpR family regulator